MEPIRENSLCVVHIRWAQHAELSHRSLAALVCQNSLPLVLVVRLCCVSLLILC